MGHNLTGEGDGNDEQIYIYLTKLPPRYDRIIVAVNIYKTRERAHYFGMINNAFIHICDNDNNQ